jgi:hypothetical protein
VGLWEVHCRFFALANHVAGWGMMARWRVDYIGKGGKHLGTVDAPDEKSAIAEAMKTFHVTPARRFKLMVTKVKE